MVKKQASRQISVDEKLDMTDDCEDEHYNAFYNLVINELLSNIRCVPFDTIMNTELIQSDKLVYKIMEAYSLDWLYRADRNIFDSKTVYTFRFPNVCDPDFYRTFQSKAHPLFVLIDGRRHRYFGWYKYIGKDLLGEIDKSLSITRVVKSTEQHRTKLFIHQDQERIDIQFDFPAIKERIVITFEPGYPEKV